LGHGLLGGHRPEELEEVIVTFRGVHPGRKATAPPISIVFICWACRRFQSPQLAGEARDELQTRLENRLLHNGRGLSRPAVAWPRRVEAGDAPPRRPWRRRPPLALPPMGLTTAHGHERRRLLARRGSPAPAVHLRRRRSRGTTRHVRLEGWNRLR